MIWWACPEHGVQTDVTQLKFQGFLWKEEGYVLKLSQCARSGLHDSDEKGQWDEKWISDCQNPEKKTGKHTFARHVGEKSGFECETPKVPSRRGLFVPNRCRLQTLCIAHTIAQIRGQKNSHVNLGRKVQSILTKRNFLKQVWSKQTLCIETTLVETTVLQPGLFSNAG